MTIGGWILLVLSWSSIIAVVAYCMAKVLKLKGKGQNHERKRLQRQINGEKSTKRQVSILRKGRSGS